MRCQVQLICLEPTFKPSQLRTNVRFVNIKKLLCAYLVFVRQTSEQFHP